MNSQALTLNVKIPGRICAPGRSNMGSPAKLAGSFPVKQTKDGQGVPPKTTASKDTWSVKLILHGFDPKDNPGQKDKRAMGLARAHGVASQV